MPMTSDPLVQDQATVPPAPSLVAGLATQNSSSKTAQTARRRARRRIPWLRIATHLGALIPFAQLLWDGANRHLTANPIQEITSRTGKTALILLVLTLACTPANAILKNTQLSLIRRPLGLYAFFYATLHFLTFTVLDYGLDWQLIWAGVVEKRYVLAGFSAFLTLIPLAITSTRGWIRRLGRRWTLLHRLIYITAILAVIHYVWLVKADISEPLAYGAAVALLLALRLPTVRRFLVRLRPARRRRG